MLNLILAESEIELVPEEIQGHIFIKKLAKKRKKPAGEILLDSNLHYKAMHKLEDAERRGRPDITHISLLYLLDSPLNRNNLLNVYVHTRGDLTIFMNPKTRIPRNYPRFCGLLEKLFKDKVIKSGNDILLELKPLNVRQLIDATRPDFTVLLDEKASLIKIDDLVSDLKKYKNPCLIIGGFPHGDFRGNYSYVNKKVSLYPGPLNVWTIACETVSSYYKAVEA